MKKIMLLSVLLVLLILPAAHAVSLTVTSFKCNDKVSLSIENGANINCAVRIQNNDGSSSVTVNTIKLMVSGGWAEQPFYSMAISTSIPAGQSIERTFEGVKSTTTGSNLKFNSVDIDGAGHSEEVASVAINSMGIKTVSFATSSSAGAGTEFDVQSSVAAGGSFSSMSLTLLASGCSLKSGESAEKNIGAMADNAVESRSWKVVQGSSASCALTITASGTTDTVTLTKSKSASVSNPDYVAPSDSTGSSSGAGGGGSGSGAGNTTTKDTTSAGEGKTSVDVSEGKAVINIPEISAGNSVLVNIPETVDVALTQLEIFAKNSVSNAKIIATKLSGRPSSIAKDASGTVYQYLQIEKENLADDDLNSVRIGFKVEKSWFLSNNIDDSKVFLQRFSGEWNNVATSKTGEDGNYIYYAATSPGFSIFAITGETKQPVQEPSEIKTTGLAVTKQTYYYTILTIIIIAAAVVYLKRKKVSK